MSGSGRGPRLSRSLVAGVNALFRAVESRRPEGERILLDPWASRLVERDVRVLAVRAGRLLWPGLRRLVDELQTAHCVRHRAIDELVLRALRERGLRQVVLLGAGDDMRASRFRGAGPVRWVEVDLEESITRKVRRLRGASELNPDVERVAHDLRDGELFAALRRTRFDPTQPACFVLEGVVHYLPRAAFERLLAELGRACPGSVLALSFIRSDVYRSAPAGFVRLVRLVREIPREHFAPEELATLAACHGLVAFRWWSFDAQVAELAPEARGRPAGLAQDVALLQSEPRGMALLRGPV